MAAREGRIEGGRAAVAGIAAYRRWLIRTELGIEATPAKSAATQSRSFASVHHRLLILSPLIWSALIADFVATDLVSTDLQLRIWSSQIADFVATDLVSTDGVVTDSFFTNSAISVITITDSVITDLWSGYRRLGHS